MLLVKHIMVIHFALMSQVGVRVKQGFKHVVGFATEVSFVAMLMGLLASFATVVEH